MDAAHFAAAAPGCERHTACAYYFLGKLNHSVASTLFRTVSMRRLISKGGCLCNSPRSTPMATGPIFRSSLLAASR